MTRFRVVLDIDWDDPQANSDDVSELTQRALEEMRTLPGMWVDVDELEALGT